ncbi:Acyl transferase domain-containing protein [Micromonospora nigra]|uniref:Acyl transferase domain-containing protein n=2 Tax=Micromonospora nigra TaxID=145857 RepID=A0A1C6RBX6_9ACTN|nr:Acyl transferase domain-containing protein [Micromonospora nigra]
MAMTPLDEHPDAVAIVGMAARLPGAPDVDTYWLNLSEGVESVTRHSREEMLAAGVSPDLVDNPNYVDATAALEDADAFDAAFFGYSAREASIMDPQHRIFLETAYHALEDAAYDPRRYDGQIGVYAGCTMNTYMLYNVMGHRDDVAAMVGDLQTMVGNDKDFLATRVSHRLDLRGPSLSVQTACSSSLVAIHLAARALADGECDMALAGGSSVRMPLGGGYLANPGGTSSPDGHCRAFDADAAGSIPGNGAGVVVLKRYADALRDGDQIHGVILGSAINNDGRAKASFTAPSIDGQYRAVSRALERAGVSARDIQFVEAHGTGTPLGDPIEVAAISRAFEQSTPDRQYCWLGSVKPNIGHLDAAAGVAGLIKAVLALRHRQVPPVVNFRRPNPKLELDTSPFRVPSELVDLESDGPLLASVNSLAMGGTNAHVVLREPDPSPAATRSARRRHAVQLSARSPEALEEMSRRLGRWAREHPGVELADVAYTLATGRQEWEHRRVVLARNLTDVASALSATGSRRQKTGQRRPNDRPVFLFPGQGAQRVGMGAALARRDPIFARHLETVLDLFKGAGLDLRSAIHPEAGDTEETRAALAWTQVTQPALFAVEWALGQTLVDLGVRPHAMLGHSIGELVAAVLAGVLDLPDAVTLVTLRGQALAETAEGAMLSVNLPVDEVRRLLDGRDLSVAAENAPSLVVVAGTEEAVEEFAALLRADGVTTTRLRVSHAFHSALVQPAAERLRAGLDGLTLREPRIPIVSNVTGDYLTAQEATSADYWVAQMCQPVRFADGVRTLVADQASAFLEVGPGRSLSALVRATASAATCLPVLTVDDTQEAEDLLGVLTDLWLLGGSYDMAAYYGDEQRARLSLPTYPFARTRHWLDPMPPAPRAAAPAQASPVVAPAAAATPAEDAGYTRTQRYLVALWKQLLGTERVGLNDSFFDLDGNSLLAMQMVTQVRRDGAAELEMTALFESPTVAGLAAHLEGSGFVPPDGPPAPDAAGAARPETAAPAQAPGGPADELAALLAEVDALSEDEVAARLAELDGTADR